MKTVISTSQLETIFEQLRQANRQHAEAFPGDLAGRQPVHTVYGGAHLFRADTTAKLGAIAKRGFAAYAPDSASLQAALGTELEDAIAEKLYQRVLGKLEREPIEDFRIDFEDGFGNRPDEEEDRTAVTAASEVAKGMAANSLPPFIGIRIKTLSDELKARSIRTLDLFLTTLLDESGGQLPAGFVVTLPKITNAAQVAALVECFEILEAQHELVPGCLKLEFMVETPESVFGQKGAKTLRHWADLANGRCVAAHFGTYDFTASMNITANHQTMDHPICDFARSVMKVALAGTGIWLSDGATNIMPVPKHRAAEGAQLSDTQSQENRQSIYRAWALSYAHIRHALRCGIYQGWDLHPMQLPIRYAAVYAFFLEALEATTHRLRNFMETAAKATLAGAVFDDAATGQGLLNFFLKAHACGAIDEAELMAPGLSLAELRSRSFSQILKMRQAGND